MQNLKTDFLEIQISEKGDKVLMAWIGQSNDVNPSILLTPYLDDLADDLKGHQLIIEYDKLKYMNSSTVPPIINFLKRLNKNKIKTTVTYDTKSKWQSASFKAMATLSLMMDYIIVKAPKIS